MNGDAGYRSRDNTRRTVLVETSDTLVVQDNTLIVQDGLRYDWSYIAQDEPTEFALISQLKQDNNQLNDQRFRDILVIQVMVRGMRDNMRNMVEVILCFLDNLEDVVIDEKKIEQRVSNPIETKVDDWEIKSLFGVLLVDNVEKQRLDVK
ncbi:hypothetical protein Tco_1507988 [Tanacetum coccineum]